MVATQTALRRWLRLRRLERHEITWLVVGACVCLLLWGFLSLADEVMEGDTATVDTRILRAFRKADDPSRPIGPEWVENSLLDLTALLRGYHPLTHTHVQK